MPTIPRGAKPWRRCLCAYVLLAALVSLVPLVPAIAVAQDAAGLTVGGSAVVAGTGGDGALLRQGPGYDAASLATLPEGTTVQVLDGPITAADGSIWYGVGIGGQTGYVVADYLTASGLPAPGADPGLPADGDAAGVAPAATDAGPAVAGSPAVTTDAVNLRAGPSTSDAVLLVMPAGAAVVTTGAPQNGFYPVTYNGQFGWASGEYLAFGAAPAPAPAGTPAPSVTPSTAAPAAGSTGIIWPFTEGTWEVIQGYNIGTHLNRSAFAQYKHSLDWARVDGETAGTPVVAPVSGTIRWVDRPSGGMLIDAGNGYGVAFFHVTIDGGFASGGRVERGQHVGTISGPGGEGYAVTPHIAIQVWQFVDGGHVSVPFDGPNAIAGREFPDIGGENQHMGVQVTV